MEDVKIYMPKLKGSVKIEKFNESGKVTFVEEKDNSIKLSLLNDLKNFMFSAIGSWNPRQTYESRTQTIYNKFRYIYLLNSNTTGNASIVPSAISETCFPLTEGDYIGYCDRGSQTLGSDVKVGLINYEESYCSTNSAKFVYQFSPSKATGQFDTIVHSELSSTGINNTNGGYESKVRSVMNGGKVFSDNRPTTWAIYKNGSDLIMCHTPILDGVNLKYTELNLTTGTSTDFYITTWNNATNGAAIHDMAVNYNAGIKTFVFYVGFVLYSVKYNDDWSAVNTRNFSNHGHIVESDYIYVKGYNNTILARLNHDLTDAGTIVTANTYLCKIGNKFYSHSTNSYYDITGATWSGETITATKHKYRYISFDTNGKNVVDGVYYWFAAYSVWVTGATSNTTSTTSLLSCPIEEYSGDSAHYKGSLIDKSEAETLKITYTFTMSE